MLQKFDERNRDLIVNINGQLVHRDKAGISPFDSAVQGGDAVWEGLRLYNSRIFKLHEHLDRLERSASALSFTEIPPRDKIIEVIKRTLELGASALILVHNHPSGDPAPSAADIAVTQDIIKAAASLGILVHDHLIIGRGGHTSLRELGLLRPESESTGANLGAPVFARPAALQRVLDPD